MGENAVAESPGFSLSVSPSETAPDASVSIGVTVAIDANERFRGASGAGPGVGATFATRRTCGRGLAATFARRFFAFGATTLISGNSFCAKASSPGRAIKGATNARTIRRDITRYQLQMLRKSDYHVAVPRNKDTGAAATRWIARVTILQLLRISDRGSFPHGLLRRVGLRPTRQRLLLATLLFARGDRHVTAEALRHEARAAGVHVTLATVYNTLNRFAKADMLRRIAVRGNLTHFDTNIADHAHFYIECEQRFLDLPTGVPVIRRLPEPPLGYEIAKVDVVVRLRKVAARR